MNQHAKSMHESIAKATRVPRGEARELLYKKALKHAQCADVPDRNTMIDRLKQLQMDEMRYRYAG